MNAMQGTMLGLAIAMGGWACSAQDATIQFGKIERDAQMSARLAMPVDEAAVSHSFGIPLGSSSSASFVRVPPVVVRRTLGSRFYLLNGLQLGMAVFDVEMTQHCIADHHCSEGNPLMPSSHAGQLSVNLALVSSSTFFSSRLKKRGSALWWLSPSVGIAAHTVGVASGIAHR
jgi:hypothetical protein